MNPLRDCLLPIALGLALTSAVRADDKKSDAKDEAQTVHGVISDFTAIGEVDVDETTGKVTTASATIVTIIGHPHHPHDAASQSTQPANKEKQAEHHRHRMNLYVVAISPKTKVSEIMASGKEVSAKDKDADFDDLEIGDRVELSFNAKNLDKSTTADKAKDGDDSKKSAMRHGRHRTYFGEAVSIKLLPDHHEAGHSAAPAPK